jgi:hypothetical protein
MVARMRNRTTRPQPEDQALVTHRVSRCRLDHQGAAAARGDIDWPDDPTRRAWPEVSRTSRFTWMAWTREGDLCNRASLASSLIARLRTRASRISTFITLHIRWLWSASSFCGAHSSASRWSQALSWLGHYLFERNTPAFFDAPNRSGPAASIAKKVQVACGGIVWSGACFLRLFHRGPLVEERR